MRPALLCLLLCEASALRALPSPPLSAPQLGCRARPSCLYRPDPALQRDSIVLLWGTGWQTLLKAAATGMKAQLGFDTTALCASLGGSFAVAATWVLAATLLDVLDDNSQRYNTSRLVRAWALAAPAAVLVRLSLNIALFGAIETWEPSLVSRFGAHSLIVDALLTLVLMYGLRKCEQEGLI